ncbi:MAG: hypothetical protein ACXVJO_17770, partial [Thermoanaerobaculia bacterium]
MRRFTLLTICSIAVLAASCSTTSTTTTTAQPVAKPAPNTPAIGTHGFDVGGMDTNVRACDDFYQFAVGKWRQSNPLPSQFARFGRFEEVAEHNRMTLREILEQDSSMASASSGSAE